MESDWVVGTPGMTGVVLEGGLLLVEVVVEGTGGFVANPALSPVVVVAWVRVALCTPEWSAWGAAVGTEPVAIAAMPAPMMAAAEPSPASPAAVLRRFLEFLLIRHSPYA